MSNKEPDARHPAFVLDAERTRELKNRMESLELGETYRSAIAAVGPPDEDYHSTPAKPPSDWKRHWLTYYVVIVGRKPGNVYDKHIDLIFDRQDKLIAIWSNIEGIPSRGDLTVPKRVEQR